jgi:hypothetical protein
MTSNYPPGVSGFEPQIAGANESESIQELNCGNDECDACYEVPTIEDWAHDTVVWFAEWVCIKCGEENSREGWYNSQHTSL